MKSILIASTLSLLAGLAHSHEVSAFDTPAASDRSRAQVLAEVTKPLQPGDRLRAGEV